MAEHDCSKHLTKVTVKSTTDKLKKHRPGIIAGILRVLAQYTDGYCAVEHADDADLTTTNGMRFWFTTDEKRSGFKNRIRVYFKEDIVAALTVT